MDIDNELDEWKLTLELARTIVDQLEREGVRKSIHLKWSGEDVMFTSMRGPSPGICSGGGISSMYPAPLWSMR